MQTIAVEEGLTDVRQALQDAGFRVTGMDPGEIWQAGAVVVSGLDVNMMGQQDIVTRAPVINAASRSAEEIVAEVRRRLQ
jgi:hypothetical protein